MADIFDTPLRRSMPFAFTRDEETLALIEAIDSRLRPLADVLKTINYRRDPESWNDELADELAWQNHVDFYDPDFELEQKRALVQNAFRFHQKKGTNAAVEELIGILFGDGRVEDWYEYGGDPGYFQVVTDNPDVTTARASEFILALNSVKRLSARLERVAIEESSSGTLYFGAVVQVGEYIEVR